MILPASPGAFGETPLSKTATLIPEPVAPSWCATSPPITFIAHSLCEARVPNSGQYPELSALATETVDNPKLRTTMDVTNFRVTFIFHSLPSP